MEKEVAQEFKRMQEKVNDLGMRLGDQSDQRHESSESLIGDLQDLLIETIYDQTLDELFN